MARIEQRPAVAVELTLRITEVEARALDALVGYGSEAFLKVFYAHLGEHYMRPYEEGLKSFFKAVREDIPPVLKRADTARAVFATGISATDLERCLKAAHTPSKVSP